ncbi:MAG: helix-turn-helix domain-containing protein [Proteobacteria bacterium]|nr:helix-turn-helix domain-containing protein [Pseudomonadota bacterium]
MPKKYKSKHARVVHEAMRGAYRAGVINEKTMRQFDESCLTKVNRRLSASQIKKLRRREGVSQAVLARHLNVDTKLVGEWERGLKTPSGPSLKLLALVETKGLDAIA